MKLFCNRVSFFTISLFENNCANSSKYYAVFYIYSRYLQTVDRESGALTACLFFTEIDKLSNAYVTYLR